MPDIERQTDRYKETDSERRTDRFSDRFTQVKPDIERRTHFPQPIPIFPHSENGRVVFLSFGETWFS